MVMKYDVVVIGAGSGGLTSAVGLAKTGKKVLLIEREHIGGECTNSGCIPSKALLHHAKSYHAAVTISGENGHTENYRREAFSYVRNKINETLAHETPEHFTKMGIDVIMGEASFSGPRSIKINNKTATFKRAVIATGSSPRLIEIPGVDPAKILTNQNLFSLESIPARIIIIGAGPIGLEMGQALALLGSAVTILDNGSTFAKSEDEAIQPIVKASFESLGITILQQANLHHVDCSKAFITHSDMATEVEIVFDKILLAIGRVPNIPLGLETASIKMTANGIIVNSSYQTTNKRVFALGDVADAMKFTHVADATARGVVTHILTKGLVRFKATAIPKVTYTLPEMAQVGLSQTEAETKFGTHQIHRIEIPYSQNDRARTDSAEHGVVVVIAKRLTGKILGTHIAGERAGELLAVFTLAIDQNISLWKLRRTIYAYPTYALLIKKAADSYFALQISTLKKDLSNYALKILPKLMLLMVWALGLFALYSYQQASGQSVGDSSLLLFTFISSSALGPLLYIAAYTIRPITFLPATALTILSGIFFGLWGGIFYTIIGANLSALFAYAIGRFFSGKNTSPADETMSRFVGPMRRNPFMSILTMRLLFLPYDAVNYGAGFLKISVLPYLLATFIGTLLGIATFVALGASISIEEFTRNGITLDVINPTFLVISAFIFVVSFVVATLIRRKNFERI